METGPATPPAHSQRIYGVAGQSPPGYQSPAGLPFNGVADPQGGPGVRRYPSPSTDFQYYPGPRSERPGGGVYPKSTGMIPRAGLDQVRYGSPTPLLPGPSPDGWGPEYGQRPLTDAGIQSGWIQQHQQPHLASPRAAPPPYSSRHHPIPQNTQVS